MYKGIELTNEVIKKLQDRNGKYRMMGFQVTNDFFYLMKSFGYCRVDIYSDKRVFNSCDGYKCLSKRQGKRDNKNMNKYLKMLIKDGFIFEVEKGD